MGRVYKTADSRGVRTNPRIKARFGQDHVSIGVYRDGGKLKYYRYDGCDFGNPGAIKTYESLSEMAKEEKLEAIFSTPPQLFIMGHGHGGNYGISNIDAQFEQRADGERVYEGTEAIYERVLSSY